MTVCKNKHNYILAIVCPSASVFQAQHFGKMGLFSCKEGAFPPLRLMIETDPASRLLCLKNPSNNHVY
jgi:hypothetical protein